MTPTAMSIRRNLLQGIVGLLDLSAETATFVTILRLYLLVWEAQVQEVLRVLDTPQP
jgi:hypothetical protein